MAKPATRKIETLPAVPHEEHAAAIERFREASSKAPRLPAFTSKSRTDPKTGRRLSRIKIDYPDEVDGYRIIGDAIGSADRTFVDGLIRDVSGLGTILDRAGAEPDLERLSYALSIIRGVKPRDSIESLLASQMAAIQIATMRMAHNLAGTENLKVIDQMERSLNQLTRTFAAQVEALKRHRSKGEQRVIVERVYVQEGGQAIVGAVEQAPGGGRSHVKLVG